MVYGEEKINYDFECINSTDYVLKLSMKSRRGLMHTIFEKSRIAFAHRNINVKGSPDEVSEFDVEGRYLNMIPITLGKTLKKIRSEIKEDNIKILTEKIHKCKFKKQENGDWFINIEFKGAYLDERK